MPKRENEVSLTFMLRKQDPLDLARLVGYLGLFNAAYETVGTSVLAERFPDPAARLRRDDLLRYLSRERRRRPPSLTIREHQESIVILRISFESPLKMVVAGSVAAITLAVVLSGGKVKVGPQGIEATLPPIGTGITNLRQALGPNPVDIRIPRGRPSPEESATEKVRVRSEQQEEGEED